MEDTIILGIAHGDEPGWKGEYWKDRQERFSISIHRAPVIRAAGSELAYCNPGFSALSYVLSSSIDEVHGRSVRTFLEQRVMTPIGIPAGAWSISYGEFYSWDGMKLHLLGGGSEFTARAAARIGQLMLQKGSWRGNQLIDSTWVCIATTSAGGPNLQRPEGHPAPGLGWWTNSGGEWEALPTDAFAGAGKRHQIVVVVPSLDLVIVRFGDSLDGVSVTTPGKEYWAPVNEHIFEPLMTALKGRPGSQP
jgi:CubicO group peptidase (beta-lactamase class C family)